MSDVTPWGETYADLAEAILADPDAPPVLLLAAFVFRHGDERGLRSLVAAAVEAEGRVKHVRPKLRQIKTLWDAR